MYDAYKLGWASKLGQDGSQALLSDGVKGLGQSHKEEILVVVLFSILHEAGSQE